MAIYTEYSVHPRFVQPFFVVRRDPCTQDEKIEKNNEQIDRSRNVRIWTHIDASRRRRYFFYP